MSRLSIRKIEKEKRKAFCIYFKRKAFDATQISASTSISPLKTPSSFVRKRKYFFLVDLRTDNTLKGVRQRSCLLY